MRRLRWMPRAAAVMAATFAPAFADTAIAQSPGTPAPAQPAVRVIDMPEGAEVPAPAATVPTQEAASPAATNCDCCETFDWKKVPPVCIFPRPGFFPNQPTGCGYYSLQDQIRGECREAPPKYGYPCFGLMQPSFFDADFRYLDDPKNTDHDVFDALKRIHLGDNWLFSTGGSIWNRYMNEYNSRLTEQDNVYDLTRVRLYGDLWYQDRLRLYTEVIGAYTVWQDLPPLAIDENKGDILNLFLDLKLMELGGKPAYLRVGRQEILLGSQRLISPLEWANTRRTFQGVRGFRQGEKFDLDLFWLQPVVPNASKLDSVDNNVNFFGAWGTYRPDKNRTLDAYYLGLDNTNRVTQQGIVRSPSTTHTLGTRYSGNRDQFLYDAELALQLGSRGSRDIVAGMATLGAGYFFKDAVLTPTVWMYYDYASGDNNPNAGNFNTFNQTFPFGHYYFGWADLVGRQNIQDLNFHCYLYPTKWMTVWLQYHKFWLAAQRDALYNAGGVAIRRDATGLAGNDVGDEFDLVLNFHLTKHLDILTGYSYLFGGDFLQRTSGPNAAVDSSLYYLQFNYRW